VYTFIHIGSPIARINLRLNEIAKILINELIKIVIILHHL